MRVWSYVITTDQGSAPNYDGPAVTLTICKPYIRRNAAKGDLVLAFNGRTLADNPHSVRWAGIVGEIIPIDAYWDDPRFSCKKPGGCKWPDNIYRLENGGWVQEPNEIHWEGDTANDISGRNALVFSIAWHMGDTAPVMPEWFGLHVHARRTVPSRVISQTERRALTDWLNENKLNVPSQAHGRPCRTRRSAMSAQAGCR